MQSVDIAIVGGGMVGLALAAALSGSDKRIAIIEPQPAAGFDAKGDYSLRVSALSYSSQALLQNLGVWQQIVAGRRAAYDDMQVWEKDSFAQIRFQASEMLLPHIGHIVENELIRQALWDKVSQQGNVQLIESAITQLHQGEREQWLNLENGTALSAKLLVGADGANSWLRQQMDVPLIYWDYQHSAIVATIKTAEPHQDCARQIFSKEGPLAFLPLPEPKLCSIVWSLPPERAQELLSASAEDFNKQLTMAFDARLGLCERQGEAAAFPLRMRYARDFAGAGFALIGDAAHTIHPLAGQGVNLGFMDAAALAETLNSTAKEDLHLHQSLRSWERWRKAEASQMIAAMESFKRLFGNDNPALKLMRGIGMNLVDMAGPVKQQAMRRALGLSGDLPELARFKATG